MKRKRFIKLCMADGKSRNEARLDAEFLVGCCERTAWHNKCDKEFESEHREAMPSYEETAYWRGYISESARARALYG